MIFRHAFFLKKTPNNIPLKGNLYIIILQLFADNLSQRDSSIYLDAGNVNVGFEPCRRGQVRESGIALETRAICRSCSEVCVQR